MSASAERLTPPWWVILAIALILAGGSFLLQGRLGINLADEGFLWYGVQRTAAGEVPLRDFQSYDPGRYYWCAAGTFLFGKGLVALRFSETLFQSLGLLAGLLAARRITTDWKLLVVIGFVFTVWMFPSHKLFDHTILLTAALVGVRLVECPSPERILTAGCFTSLCAFFGRNHALYSFVALGALLLLLGWKMRRELPMRHLLLWCCGIGAGFIPLLLMLLFVPGFYPSYRESVEAIFRNGANLGLPVPWPWRIPYSGDWVTMVSRILLGVSYLALPLFYLGVIWSSFRMSVESLKKYSLLVACAFVGLPYFHHALARADINHLAQAIHPFTLGAFAAFCGMGFSRPFIWLGATALAGMGVLEGAPQSPLFQPTVTRTPWVAFDAGGEIRLPAADARFYGCLRRFTQQNLDPRETLLIAPFMPGLYSILDRPSPVWELYFFFPATEPQEIKAIEELRKKEVNWALVSRATLDRRPDLRFASTHRLMSEYLAENFYPWQLDCLPKGLELLRRKPVSPPDKSVLK